MVCDDETRGKEASDEVDDGLDVSIRGYCKVARRPRKL